MQMAAAATKNVVLIDQSHPQDCQNDGLLSNPSNFQVHTGNIANWNSLKSRKTQLPANELYHSLHTTIDSWITNNLQKDDSWKGCFSEETFESAEERPLIKITVKVLLHKLVLEHLEEALKAVLDTLKIEYCDQLILSLPPVDEDRNFGEVVEPFWKKMEDIYFAGTSKHISSCDLDQEKLEALIKIAKIKPEVNQVNLTSCCHMPEDLVAYAKEIGVVLHTHGDQPVMLPNEKLSNLIESIDDENNLHWSTNWIVRYAVVVKCRGVIKSKGYIASVQSTRN